MCIQYLQIELDGKRGREAEIAQELFAGSERKRRDRRCRHGEQVDGQRNIKARLHSKLGPAKRQRSLPENRSDQDSRACGLGHGMHEEEVAAHEC